MLRTAAVKPAAAAITPAAAAAQTTKRPQQSMRIQSLDEVHARTATGKVCSSLNVTGPGVAGGCVLRPVSFAKASSPQKCQRASSLELASTLASAAPTETAEKPKKPMNSFSFFRLGFLKSIREQGCDDGSHVRHGKHNDPFKEASKRWTTFTDKEKQPFVSMYQADKLRYADEMVLYNRAMEATRNIADSSAGAGRVGRSQKNKTGGIMKELCEVFPNVRPVNLLAVAESASNTDHAVALVLSMVAVEGAPTRCHLETGPSVHPPELAPANQITTAVCPIAAASMLVGAVPRAAKGTMAAASVECNTMLNDGAPAEPSAPMLRDQQG